MEWIRQVISPFFCPHLAKDFSKPKVVTRGSFPHRCTASHASVWVDRRCLDVCAVVSLTALDMMYALITLAHALGEKTLQIMSIFTQIVNRLQKLERMIPTHTIPPTH